MASSSTSTTTSSTTTPGVGDEFSERVKKTFGSLLTASLNPPSSSSSRSRNPLLWSLSGTDVEKREWRRDKEASAAREHNPCSSSFATDEGLDGFDLKGSIGLDSTLDNEEEEDTYDKVAIGRENAGERLYMSDIKDNHDAHVGSEDDLSSLIGSRLRDPRANRRAARLRLKEDDVAAGVNQAQQHKGGQPPPARAEKVSSPSPEELEKLKPILKRKENDSTSKASKRVRFDESVKEASVDIISAEASNSDERVPDYVRNPSKYKCYTLDSSNDINNKSNTGAYLDVLEMVKKSKNEESGSQQGDASLDLPKSVTFVPKKKLDHKESTQDRDSHVKESPVQPTLLVGVAAMEEQETGVGDMEIDEPQPSAGSGSGTTFRKHGRQYRSKTRGDSPV